MIRQGMQTRRDTKKESVEALDFVIKHIYDT